MPVDYSKWDAIELSDDEDFECHPNVDKKSMIRWKQAQIHMKRKDLNDKIQALNLENEMSNQIIKLLQNSEINQDLTVKIQELNKEFEKKVYDIVMQGRNPQWDYPIPNEFLKKRIDLNQLSKEIKPENKNLKIQELNTRINQVKEELEKEELEKSKKITSDTIKTGFDSSNIAKKEVVKEKVVETIHEPKNVKESVDPQENDDEKDYITYKPAENFAYLKGLDASLKALSCNPELIGQKYSDEILAEAFRLEMKGKSEEAFNCVQQSLILQYCGLLGKDGISLFFKRMESSAKGAMDMFKKDCHDTFARIHKRVKEIHAESEEEERQEQLEALARLEAAKQADGTFALPVGPDGEGETRAQVFAGFHRDFQEALLLQDVDKINHYLATLSKEDAETIVKSADEVGLLTLQVEE